MRQREGKSDGRDDCNIEDNIRIHHIVPRSYLKLSYNDLPTFRSDSDAHTNIIHLQIHNTKRPVIIILQINKCVPIK